MKQTTSQHYEGKNMNRTAAGEAKRQVALAETMYRRLVEKQAAARTAYEAKIETLKATYAELLEAESANA